MPDLPEKPWEKDADFTQPITFDGEVVTEDLVERLETAGESVIKARHDRDVAVAAAPAPPSDAFWNSGARPSLGQAPLVRHDLFVGTRDWQLGPPMRKPPFPEAMPDLRHNLMDGWAKWWPSAFESAPAITLLNQASLWWVGEEMCDLLYATLPSIPPETMVENLVLPETYGLVFLQRPMTNVIDAETGQREGGEVDAITWANAIIGSTNEPCLSVSSYRYIDFGAGLSQMDTLLAANLKLLSSEEKVDGLGLTRKLIQSDQGKMEWAIDGGVWAPLGRSDWPHGTRIDSPSAATLEESPIAPRIGTTGFDLSAQEDRRLISALFTLLNTASLATVEERKPSRQVVRNAQRKNKPVPKSVKVVYLRRPKSAPRPGAEVEGSHYSHRFAVRAHPRMQAYGPGRSLRRLIMVPAHIRGPQDKPFVAKEEVKAWVR